MKEIREQNSGELIVLMLSDSFLDKDMPLSKDSYARVLHSVNTDVESRRLRGNLSLKNIGNSTHTILENSGWIRDNKDVKFEFSALLTQVEDFYLILSY